MKNVVILGSTGSIGRQAVEIISNNRDKFKAVAIAACKNAELLLDQALLLKPDIVCISDTGVADQCRDRFKDFHMFGGETGLVELAAVKSADIVLNAVVGAAGLPATLAAINAGNDLALANKESLVAGGDLVSRALRGSTSRIIPVDSEHSAVFQCLIGEDPKEISRIILTASGGPFRGKKINELKDVDPDEAVAHPRWNMGKKISVDSATLMNKGLEVIEAHFLFGVPYDKIDIIVHPQSIIHSMVEFTDGSIKAHLGPTDMRIPIQYALSYPKRYRSTVTPLSLADTGSLTFEKLRIDDHPALKVALRAASMGGSFPAVMNAANEVAVNSFLKRRITFTDIGKIIKAVVDGHIPREIQSLDDFADVDGRAREKSMIIIAGLIGPGDKEI